MILSRTLPRHPFASFSDAGLRRTALASTAGSLLFGGLMLAFGRPLTTAAAPHGLGSFEFAWTPELMSAVLASWGEAGVALAKRMEWVDYGFLASYPVSLAALSVLVPGARRLPSLAAAASWAGLLAGPLDAVENAAGLLILSSKAISPGLLLFQTACAAPKFLLAFLSLGWVAAGAFIKAPRD